MTPKDYAYEKHADQLYGKGNSAVPYSYHLEAVYDVLIRFGFTDADLLACAYLHDVMEDADASYNDLVKEFNVRIAEAVYAVTDEKGRNRKERKAKTYPGIRKNPDAIIIKLADRIANLEHGIENKDSLFSMYKKEHDDFRKALYTPGTSAEVLWQHLDNLFDENKM